MKSFQLILTLLPLLPLLGSISDAQAAPDSAAELKTEEIVAGKGAEAKKGSTVTVHYTGWLNEGGKKGKKFDSSLDRGDPFSFSIGAHMVIQGWEDGVPGMKVGGKRTLYIPYTMAYGERGYPPVIPPKSDLIFEVELLSVGK